MAFVKTNNPLYIYIKAEIAFLVGRKKKNRTDDVLKQSFYTVIHSSPRLIQ